MARTTETARRNPDAPVDPQIEAQVREYLKKPYRMVVRGDPDEGYLAEAPELPGCFTAGETPSEAMDLLRDAMAGWLTSALEHGHAVPEPASADDREYSGKFVMRVPKSLHKQLAEQAEEEGVSLNQLALTYLARGVGLLPTAPIGIAEDPRVRRA